MVAQGILGGTMNRRRTIINMAAVLVLVGGISTTYLVRRASSSPKVYKPTEVQSLRLQVKQKDALIAMRDFQAIQQKYQQAVQELTTEAERVKVEQKWDPKTQFDPNTLSFSEPPAAPPPA